MENELSDNILAVPAITIIFAAISTRSTLINTGLGFRLITALAQGKTSWPGPITQFFDEGEMRAAMSISAPRPNLYSRYLSNAFMIALATFVFLYYSYFFMSDSNYLFKDRISSAFWILIIAVLVYIKAARRVGKYDAAVEWALCQSPYTPLDTAEADEVFAQNFHYIRKAIKRIWNNLWLMSLSSIFIWHAFMNHEGSQIKNALVQPQVGPVMRKHVEQVGLGTTAYYFPTPDGSIMPRQKSDSENVSQAVFRTFDNQDILVARLEREPMEYISGKAKYHMVIYYPFLAQLYPDIGVKYPRVLAVIGEKEMLESFATRRYFIPPFMSVIYIGFCVYSLYIITSLRRWLRVAFAKKGRYTD